MLVEDIPEIGSSRTIFAMETSERGKFIGMILNVFFVYMHDQNTYHLYVYTNTYIQCMIQTHIICMACGYFFDIVVHVQIFHSITVWKVLAGEDKDCKSTLKHRLNFFAQYFIKNLWNFLFTSRKFTKAVSQGADGWLAGCWLKFSSFTSTDYIYI